MCENSIGKEIDIIGEIDENKWIVMGDNKKYNELLHEIESLKTMIIDLHTIIVLQNEGVDKSSSNIMVIKDKINGLNKTIDTMKSSQENQTKYGYIRDYVFPAISMITVNYPIFWVLGPKTGMIASTLSYMIWKFR